MLNFTLQQINLLKGFQTFFLVIGFVFNVRSVFVVVKYKIFQSQFTKHVIRNQFMFDSIICFITPLVLWVKQYIYDINSGFDMFVCYFWDSQGYFWMLCLFRNQNLVWITLDRYFAVIYPTVYKMKKNILLIAYSILIILICLPQGVGFSLILGVRNQSCVLLLPPESLMFPLTSLVYSIFSYVIPIFIFVICYSRVYLKLRAMQENANNNENFRKSTFKFTIACFINVLLFISLQLMSDVLVILQCVSLFSYAEGMDVQAIALFLVSINSCVSSVAYLVFMNNFRKCFFDIRKSGSNKVSTATGTIIM